MKKIEKLRAFGFRYKWSIAVVLILLMMLFALFYSFVYGQLWLRFPAKIRAEIAINRLGVSSYNDPVCHETCFYERQTYKQIIAASLAEGNIKSKVERLILAEDNNLTFRLELIDIWSSQPGLVPPEYLSAYLSSGSDQRVKEKIRELFAVGKVPIAGLLDRFAGAVSSAEKINLLGDLQERSDSSLAGFYLDLIAGDPDLKVRDSALSALSNLLPSDSYVTDGFLSRIRGLIVDPKLDQYLRRELVSLLSGYLEIQEKPVTEILAAVYSNEKNVDKFSRLFAADILNRSSANNYDKPEISESEWQEYRDHNSLWGNN